jgi:hypothetical protein
VHEEELDITDVVDEESLVAGWHHVAGLLVGTETDLFKASSSAVVLDAKFFYQESQLLVCDLQRFGFVCTYRWHHHLSLEASADSVVDTLWLSPAGIDTHIGVTLMSVEALRA